MHTKISATEILTFYMEFFVEHQCKPNSVEDFVQMHQFDEADFYEHYASFKDLEKHIYNLLFENSLVTLKNSPEYHSFAQKDKLLSFYYTFFENLALNQDFVKLNLKGLASQLKALSIFSLFKKNFTRFIDELELQKLSLNLEVIEAVQKKAIKESAWIQLLLTIKFWLDDTSEGFDKTDIFIEKSINTSIELLNTKSLNNIIDLAKFLYQEKIQS